MPVARSMLKWAAVTAVSLITVIAGKGTALGQRLPDTVVPSHYEVKWAPDLTTAKFTGSVSIDVAVAQPTRTIVLNALDLSIPRADVMQGGTTRPAAISIDREKQQATLEFEAPVAPGDARLTLEFAGTLNDTLAGLYLTKTPRRAYAATQFEATDARRAFPCFDEPALKATFDVIAVIDSGDMAISNMPVRSDTPGPAASKHTVRFATTKPLSTYLVALLVGDFECLEGTEGGIPLRICATPGHREEGRFALAATKAVLSNYTRYFSAPYPFPKLDQIAIPDFMAGAMENAGAIVYRETALLVDERTASIDKQNDVAGIIAHEIAHQWFGDLVTMRWWNDVWLNEGFATWMTSKPLTEWKPDWDVPLQDVQSTAHALASDAVASTRSIQAEQADTPAEIEQLFDAITYDKTAAVLRMLEQYLGPDVFRRGVNAYLERHAWANATAEDFWSALTEASGKPVDAIMRSFVTQPGTPLLSVSSACDGGRQRVTVSQRRFFTDPAKLEAGSAERWSIPVCFRRAGDAPQCELIDAEHKVIELDGCRPWVVANAEGRGYYRTAYTDGSAERIGHAAADLSPAERTVFLDDQWALTYVGIQTIPAYLEMVAALGSHATDRVMEVAWEPLEHVWQDVVAPADRPKYQGWVRELAHPYLDAVGREPRPGDTIGVLRTRARVLSQLAIVGRDPDAIAWLRQLMDRYLSDPASIPSSLIDPAVAGSSRFGDAALFDRMVRTIETTTAPDVRAKLEYALVRFESPDLLRRALERALTPAVRNQDMLYMLLAALRGHDTRPMVWSFIKAHLAEIQTRSGSLASTAIVSSAGAMCDPALRDDARTFFAAHPIEGAEVTLQQGLEHADACIRLAAQERPKLTSWLEKKVTTTAAR
jgi:aminopeptidase N